MGIGDFFEFKEDGFRQRMEELALDGDFNEIRRQEVKSIRKAWGAGTGATIGGLAAIPTMGLSLIGSGIGGRRLYVHNKKIEIARSVLGTYGIPPYEARLRDKWVPAIASTLSFGVAVGMDGGIANHIIDSGAQHLGIAGVTPGAHHTLADNALARATGAGTSIALMSTLDSSGRTASAPTFLRPTWTEAPRPHRRATAPITQAKNHKKGSRSSQRQARAPYSYIRTDSKEGAHLAMKFGLSLLFTGICWYIVLTYHKQILSLEMSWVKKTLRHIPAPLLGFVNWTKDFIVSVMSATFVLSYWVVLAVYSILFVLLRETWNVLDWGGRFVFAIVSAVAYHGFMIIYLLGVGMYSFLSVLVREVVKSFISNK